MKYWNQRIQCFVAMFSRNEVQESVCNQFNLVDEVHTRDTRNNSLIYIPTMSTTQYSNMSLRGDGAFLIE